MTNEELCTLYLNALCQIIRIIGDPMLSDMTRIIAITAILRTVGLSVEHI